MTLKVKDYPVTEYEEFGDFFGANYPVEFKLPEENVCVPGVVVS
jgi:hypothetical protein